MALRGRDFDGVEGAGDFEGGELLAAAGGEFGGVDGAAADDVGDGDFAADGVG